MAMIDQKSTTTNRRPTLSGEEEATSSVKPKAAAPGALVSRKMPEIASTHQRDRLRSYCERSHEKDGER